MEIISGQSRCEAKAKMALVESLYEVDGSGPVKRPIDFLANIQCFFTNILPIRINRLLANLICQMNLPRGL
jgi:hypothetical protein